MPGGRIRLFRKLLKRGFLHPIQVSVVRLVEGEDGAVHETIVHKLLMRSALEEREVHVAPGRYALRAREVPLGCNVQGEQLVVTVGDAEPVCVTLRTAGNFQVLLAGFGGCLFPPGSVFRHKAFYFDEVSVEAFQHDLQKAPAIMATLEKTYQLHKATSSSPGAATEGKHDA